MKAVQSLNYIPSQIGRSLSTRSTQRVALVADLGNPLFPQLMTPIHNALMAHGYRMVAFAESGDSDTAVEYDSLFNQSVDGVILTTVRLDSTLPAALARRGIPFALLNRTIPGTEPYSCVADNVGGAQLVAERFLVDGHTRIGALLGPDVTSSALARERGFRDALADAGVALPSRYLFREWFTYEGGYMGLKAVMAARPAPTAIFCVNDYVAVGAINAAIEMGLRIPDDVALIGFDDLPVAGWPAFDLTTVRVDFDAMSRGVVDLLVQQLREPGTAPGQRTFPTELVLRKTHGSSR